MSEPDLNPDEQASVLSAEADASAQDAGDISPATTDDVAVDVEDEAAGDAADGDEAAEAGDEATGDEDSEDTEDKAAEEELEADPVEEFMRQLRAMPGDWYVIHSYAGYENRVKTNLENRIGSLNMEDYIFQIEVPVHNVTEVKQGKRQQVSEKVLPGYILVRLELTDESWAVVRNTPGVTGFVGLSSRPSPLSLQEVASLLAPEPEEQVKQAEAKRTVVPTEDGIGRVEQALGVTNLYDNVNQNFVHQLAQALRVLGAVLLYLEHVAHRVGGADSDHAKRAVVGHRAQGAVVVVLRFAHKNARKG